MLLLINETLDKREEQVLSITLTLFKSEAVLDNNEEQVALIELTLFNNEAQVFENSVCMSLRDNIWLYKNVSWSLNSVISKLASVPFNTRLDVLRFVVIKLL